MTDEALTQEQLCTQLEWRARGAIRQVEDSISRAYPLNRSDLNYGRAAALRLQTTHKPGTDSDHLLRDVENAIKAAETSGVRIIEDVPKEGA